MRTTYLAQPDVRLGDFIEQIVQDRGVPLELVVVSAFAALPTVLRLKGLVTSVKAAAGDVRIILGVDLGGTSKEVLQEVASWDVAAYVVKNSVPGSTFHPKIYLLRWQSAVELIVGSNNLTEGGLYRNYEAATQTSYDLPQDGDAFAQASSELKRFIAPESATSLPLTPTYLASLLSLKEIPSENEARRLRGEARANLRLEAPRPANIFSSEPVRPAPRLPPELQRFLLAVREKQHSDWKKAKAKARKTLRAANGDAPVLQVLADPQQPTLPAQLDPEAFYMNPVTSKGANNPNIPGEQRIPLEALEMASDFWGWPTKYDRVVSPRKGDAAREERVYRNWRTPWRIWSTDDPETVFHTVVRMYFYENSSDFRFHSGDLVRLGAAAGDIIRLRRLDEENAIFECALARVNTPEHRDWDRYLILTTKGNADRRFGFA